MLIFSPFLLLASIVLQLLYVQLQRRRVLRSVAWSFLSNHHWNLDRNYGEKSYIFSFLFSLNLCLCSVKVMYHFLSSLSIVSPRKIARFARSFESSFFFVTVLSIVSCVLSSPFWRTPSYLILCLFSFHLWLSIWHSFTDIYCTVSISHAYASDLKVRDYLRHNTA